MKYKRFILLFLLAVLSLSLPSCGKKKIDQEKKEQLRQLKRYKTGGDPITDTLRVIGLYHHAVEEGHNEFLLALGDIHFACGNVDSALYFYHKAVKHDEQTMLTLADMYVGLALDLQLDTARHDLSLIEHYYCQSARYYRAYIHYLHGEIDDAYEYIEALESENVNSESAPEDRYFRR